MKYLFLFILIINTAFAANDYLLSTCKDKDGVTYEIYGTPQSIFYFQPYLDRDSIIQEEVYMSYFNYDLETVILKDKDLTMEFILVSEKETRGVYKGTKLTCKSEKLFN